MKAVKHGETNGKTWILVVTTDDEKYFLGRDVTDPIYEGMQCHITIEGKTITSVRDLSEISIDDINIPE